VIAYDIVDASVEARYAVREVDSLSPEDGLGALADVERDQHRALAGTAGLHSHAVALDADRWELVRYSLWRDEACATKARGDAVQTYEVLHLSSPGSDRAKFGEVLRMSTSRG
jgi:hypothetical protein